MRKTRRRYQRRGIFTTTTRLKKFARRGKPVQYWSSWFDVKKN